MCIIGTLYWISQLTGRTWAFLPDWLHISHLREDSFTSHGNWSCRHRLRSWFRHNLYPVPTYRLHEVLSLWPWCGRCYKLQITCFIKCLFYAFLQEGCIKGLPEFDQVQISRWLDSKTFVVVPFGLLFLILICFRVVSLIISLFLREHVWECIREDWQVCG